MISEKVNRLLFMSKLQGMTAGAYWAGTVLWTVILSLVMFSTFLIFGLLFKPTMFQAVNWALFIIVTIVWGFVQAGMGTFISGYLRYSALAMMMVYLGSAAGAIASIVYIATDIPADFWAYFFPSIIYGMIVNQALGAPNPLLLAQLYVQTLGLLLVGAAYILIGLYGHAVVGTAVEPGLSPLFFLDPLRPYMPAWTARISAHPPKHDDSYKEPEDMDVVEERERVMKSMMVPDETLAIACHGLRKQYSSGKVAVHDFYLTASSGECLGLLGPNGAGKTSVLNMLSGLTDATSGFATICGFNIADRAKFLNVLGVCPQFDVLWPSLTVRQTLQYYARVRNCRAEDMSAWVQKAAESVTLDGDTFDAFVSTLSGGQRRRLSIAVALMGDPQCVLMDEPSTGLDPDTRLQIWKVINKQKSGGRCIILSTHSMEEADALCTRVAIMAAGKLRCIGNQTRLKQRFGQGSTMTAEIEVAAAHNADPTAAEKSATETVLAFLLTSVSELTSAAPLGKASDTVRKLTARLNPVSKQEECCWTIHRQYMMSSVGLDLERVFAAMESQGAGNAGIRSWSLAEASLDEVFITCTRDYMDED